MKQNLQIELSKKLSNKFLSLLYQILTDFYQRGSISSYANAGSATVGMSVCPANSSIASKRTKLASRLLNQLRARRLRFIAKFEKRHPGRGC